MLSQRSNPNNCMILFTDSLIFRTLPPIIKKLNFHVLYFSFFFFSCTRLEEISLRIFSINVFLEKGTKQATRWNDHDRLICSGGNAHLFIVSLSQLA